jgi:hypothetical protein
MAPAEHPKPERFFAGRLYEVSASEESLRTATSLPEEDCIDAISEWQGVSWTLWSTH